MNDLRPLLALVPGEPAGVGLELLVRLMAEHHRATLLVIADPAVLAESAERLDIPLEIRVLNSLADVSLAREWADEKTGRMIVLPVTQPVPTVPGVLAAENAASVIDALNLASDLALARVVDGIVTGPTHKAHLLRGGFPYSGTTEWLANRAGCGSVMVLAHDRLRVVLVTTHLPLREVADAITESSLRQTLLTAHHALQTDFGIPSPRIAVLGLNPHAGEDGGIGREEIEIYAPVLASLRQQGLNLMGPLSADTAFLPHRLENVDAVVAAYHDQGLPVLKHSGFERAVNVTLGLPYPRVAVDHGTALDLVGSMDADPSSLRMAIQTCAQIAQNRRVAGDRRQ